jgi:alpha-tubulin suppressor-like RCC1 family protein
VVLVLGGVLALVTAASCSAASTSRALNGWGDNVRGEIGDASFVVRPTPVAVRLPSRPIAISSGGDHTLALVAGASAASNTVYSWGVNQDGQLGNNLLPPARTGLRKETPYDSNSPVPVLEARTNKKLTNVAAVAAGAAFSLALLNDGTVRAWGSNEFGELGNPNSRDVLKPAHSIRAIPVLKSPDGTVLGIGHEKVIAVSAGASHALALLSNGTVMAWGKNNYGQLGTGSSVMCAAHGKSNGRTTPCGSFPDPIAGGSRPCSGSAVASVAAGAFHSLAICADHTVWAWGANGAGQLGLGAGDTTDRPVPTRVPSIADAVQVAAGGFHSLALTIAGGVLAWGANNVGQLGTGSDAPSGVPLRTFSFGVGGVAAGYEHSLALMCNRTVEAWGSNGFGQLGNRGDGQRTSPADSTRPLPIAKLTGVIGRLGLSASYYNSFAITGGKGPLC